MRLFVGIELEPPLQDAVGAVIAALRRDLEERAPDIRIRWLPPANLHLTLAFIGEVQDAFLEPIRAALAQGFSVPAFDLAFGSAGTFPAAGPLRVVWIGVAQGEAALRQLHDEIVGRLGRLGLRFEERAYSPHLTVGRVREGRGPAARRVREVAREGAAALGPQHVAAVTLFRSRLSPAGSTYDVVMRVPLQG